MRFGIDPIRSTYLVNKANFIACHQWYFIEIFHLLGPVIDDSIFLLNSPYKPDKIWHYFPCLVQEQVINKQLKVYTIKAYEVARNTGMGGRINTVMQTCFFALSGVLPR